MSLETTPTVALQLSNTLQKLQSDLENIQREVDQALGVWRLTLIDEKKEFQDVLQEKERNWAAQENDWLVQKAVFESKIQELEQFYKTQISSSEQNALQALNELDDSWQRDKVLWNQAIGQRIKDFEARESLLAAECLKREADEKYLGTRIADLSTALADKGRDAEEQAARWQSDRNAYEEKLQALEEAGRAAEKNREQSQSEALDALKASWAQEKIAWQTERDALNNQRRAAEEAFQTAEKARELSHSETLEALKASWQIERSALDHQRVAAEEAFQVAEKARAQEQVEAIEMLKTSWERDKMAWQESHQQTLQESSISEKAWAHEWQKQNRTIRQLEETLATVQSKLDDASTRSLNSNTFLWSSLEALDNQVALLNEVLELASRPIHPLRRSTDAVSNGRR